MSDLISSRANPLIKELRALQQKKYREQRGEFLVYGIQPVLQAIQSGAPLRMLVTAPDILTSKTARQIVRQQERAGTRVVQVSREALEAVTGGEHATGLAAVVKIVPRTLDELRVDDAAVFVALDQVSNAGNLGAILRTADAVGTRGVIMSGAATDAYAPAAVTASRGAIFSVPLVRVETIGEVLGWSRAHAVQIVTTSDRAPTPVWDAELTRPLLLVFGNEGEGLDAEIVAQGRAVRIPMAGAVDSLNLAVAAGVLLYECARRQHSSDAQNQT
ncbi:MAG: RNA methyltransferase [Anaerolineae bacterium]|nr:RNA methyltransferase [Anaerolineae bacterium]